MASGTVTVFGGTGFLGGRIVRRLSTLARDVRVAARHLDRACRTDLPQGVSFVQADVRDESTVMPAVEGAQTVINVVGLYAERRDETFDAVHVRGARTVARCAARAGATRLLHISGIGASLDSPSAYVRARAQGERQVCENFPRAIILRPSVLFGPGDSFLNTLDAITRVAPVIPLFGRGDTRMQPVYVEDVADAVASTMGRSLSPGPLYELGGPHVYTYRGVIETVLRHRGRTRALLPVPFAVWLSLAKLLGVMPNPPVSVDQVILMRGDNVASTNAATLEDLHVTPRSMQALLPVCLR